MDCGLRFVDEKVVWTDVVVELCLGRRVWKVVRRVEWSWHEMAEVIDIDHIIIWFE